MPQSTTTIAGKTTGATVTVTITEPDPPRPATPAPLVIGANVPATDFDQLAPGGRDEGARFSRTFCAPGDGILGWDHSRRKLPAGVAEFLSFKDWPSDTTAIAAVVRLLDTMPARLLEDPPLLPELRPYDPDGFGDTRRTSDGFSLLLSWRHEGEPDCIRDGIPAREWRRRHRLAYRTIREHRNGWRVGYMPIQTGTWTEANSAPAEKKIKGDFDPLAWWAGVGDYAGYDAYLPSITTKPAGPGLYRPAEEFLAVPLQLARATGRRLFLPELGVILQGDQPRDTGVHRAAWIRAAVNVLRDQGAAGVGWWDALGAKDRDFRLTDEPSRTAWQDAIAGR